MKTYTINQVAEMHHVNPETVRQWIKTKQLTATQIDKEEKLKKHYIITEDNLADFYKKYPKKNPLYKSSMLHAVGMSSLAAGGAMIAGASLLGAAPIAISTLLAAGVVSWIQSVKGPGGKLTAAEQQSLEEAISNAIEEKKSEIVRAQDDIYKYQEILADLRAMKNNSVEGEAK